MSKEKIAIFVCSDVIGGHEFQVAELANSLKIYFDVTVFLNVDSHIDFFISKELNVISMPGIFFRKGFIFKQILNGFFSGNKIMEIASRFDRVIISAGAVESGISAGLALRGLVKTALYLPFFYDRVPVFGVFGYLYNWFLKKQLMIFDEIITINRIQAYLLKNITSVPVEVVNNKVRDVEISIGEDKTRLVYIGRFDKQKRIIQMMQWLDNIDNPYKDMLFIGDGPQKIEVEELARRMKFLSCQFLGWCSANEQDLLIHPEDVLILNSLVEGEPLVIREAKKRGMYLAIRNIQGVRGITSKMQRYNSSSELIELLKAISKNKKNQGFKKNIESSSKRDLQIFNLSIKWGYQS